MTASIPPQFRHAVIAASLRCQQCGYDLQGLDVAGRCPECGLANGESIVFAVDPDASRLPQLADARRVGDAVLWLAVCMLMATVSLAIRPLLLQLDTVAPVWDVVPPILADDATLWSAGWSILGLIACLMLAPPRGREPSSAVWRDIGLLGIGLLLFALFALLQWRNETRRPAWLLLGAALSVRSLYIAMALSATIALLGLRNVFAIIGQRSREWRSSRGGRQRVLDMIAAVIIIIVGQILQIIAEALKVEPLYTIGTVVIWICNFMILVGLIYLVVNTWWMRRSLRRPRPTYDQVLLPPLPADATLAEVDEGEDFHVDGHLDGPPVEPGDTSQPPDEA